MMSRLIWIKSDFDGLGYGGVGKVSVCVAIFIKALHTSGAIQSLIDRASTDKQFSTPHNKDEDNAKSGL